MSETATTTKPSKEQQLCLESSLQQFLQIVIKAYKKYSDCENEVGGIEDKYSKEKGGREVTGIIEDAVDCFGILMKKIESRLRESEHLVIQENEEYRRLEEILQKHEAENRGYLRESLQLKLIIDSQKIKLEDVEKEKQEATNSMKQHLTQKSKEILSLHNEISALKKKVEDFQSINENQEFSIREYESQIQEIPQLRQKCKQLQNQIEEYEQQRDMLNDQLPSKQLSSLQRTQLKKEGKDTDLNKHINTSTSNRNRVNLNASSISTTLGTNTQTNLTNNKLYTPSKIERKGLLQNHHLLSSSSRGGSSSNNQSISAHPLLDISEGSSTKQTRQYSQISQSQPLSQYLQQGSLVYQQQQQLLMPSSLSQQLSKQQASVDKSFTKQQLLKQIKESNNTSKDFNSQKSKDGKNSNNNSSNNIESKDLASYLNGGIILPNNGSYINQNESIKQHKRSKSSHGKQLKGALLSTTTGRTSSSLNQRNRALNSTHVNSSQDSSILEYASTQQQKDQFIDVHLTAINTSLPNPQISQHPFSATKGNNNSSSNNNNISGSQNQILQQLYGQNSGGRSGYGSSAKRVSSRASQYK